MKSTIFPFATVVGQEAIKKSLIWNIVNPCIGGVLISGEKGTAKSTISKWLSEKNNNSIANRSGRRSLVKTSSTQGRYVKYRYPIKGEIKDIAI
jgi:hypothetical protein